MGRVNKQSIRDEAERINNEFKRMAYDKKINSEVNTLINAMLLLINLLVSIFLEKSTVKNSKNSSIPPSQTQKDESALSQKGSKGKGKTEMNQIAGNTRTIERTEIAFVEQCPICGFDLSNLPCTHHERRTKMDIVFEKVIVHVDAEVKECPSCDSTVKGEFPKDMPGPLQYGNGLKAYIINLLVCQMISLNRAQMLVKALIGEIISQTSMLNFIIRLYVALEKWESNAIEALLNLPAMHVDETGLRVDKKNYWIHVYAGGDITLKCLHRKRGIEAIEAINIIPRYSGTIIHDCWCSYFNYGNCKHGLCGSHLVRELTGVIEANGYQWAKNIKKLLLEACKKVSKRKNKKLIEKDYASLQRRYRNILSRGKNELPAIPEKVSGQRGRMARSDAHNLLERLIEHEAAVLLFAKDSHVSFTNNRAERDLRMSKVKQKVSGCFRKEEYAKAYCRISSYLQTMASKGINPLIAIQMAFAGEFI
jgi:hypothetical protein